jgi:nucleoside-diphosphate-sugar epimerase
MTRVLLTGANGFVGRVAAQALESSGFLVRGAVRSPAAARNLPCRESVVVGSIEGATDWRRALDGVDAVLHLASRVHQVHDTSADPLAEYRRVNVEGTRALAGQAAAAGVRRFVLVSSIKVNGEQTSLGRPFREGDPEADTVPSEPYARSKWEAERVVWEIAGGQRMEGVVVRPPLVYGPGVKANFYTMLAVIDKGIPLPFGSIRNERSLVYVGNLADFLKRVLTHPAAAGRKLLVSDGPPLSTPQLLTRVGHAMGRRPRLLPIPPGAMRAVGRAIGRGAAIDRLCGSLAVDDGPSRRDLGWEPPFTMHEGLRETVGWYRGRGEEVGL